MRRARTGRPGACSGRAPRPTSRAISPGHAPRGFPSCVSRSSAFGRPRVERAGAGPHVHWLGSAVLAWVAGPGAVGKPRRPMHAEGPAPYRTRGELRALPRNLEAVYSRGRRACLSPHVLPASADRVGRPDRSHVVAAPARPVRTGLPRRAILIHPCPDEIGRSRGRTVGESVERRSCPPREVCLGGEDLACTTRQTPRAEAYEARGRSRPEIDEKLCCFGPSERSFSHLRAVIVHPW